MLALPRLVFAALLVSTPVLAQCPLQWLPGYGCPGVGGDVVAMTRWDPDGPGAMGELVAIGGAFRVVDGFTSLGLAYWDPGTGAFGSLPAIPPVPASPGFEVNALAALPNGELVVATRDAGVARIVSWDGATWTQLGPDFQADLSGLLVRPSGHLLACGTFQPVGGGSSLGSLLAWTGSAWSPFAAVNGAVRAMANGPSGELIVVGSFTSIGGVAAPGIARWDGTSWSAIGSTTLPSPVAVAAVGSRVFVAFGEAGLWQWDGVQWSAIGGFTSFDFVGTLAVTGAGKLVVGGLFEVAGRSSVAVLDAGTGAWTSLGSGLSRTELGFGAWARSAMELPTGELLVGGRFGGAGSVLCASLARWDGAAWHALADGPTRVTCGTPIDDTSFVVGGAFTTFGNLAVANVAKWTGTAWSPLGGGFDGEVRDIVRLPNGDLVAGGDFTTAGGVPARRLARWDGVAWSEFGGGLVPAPFNPLVVDCLLVRANGTLVASGVFASAGGVTVNNIAVWNGASWAPLGTGLVGGVSRVVEAANGDLYAVANLTQQVHRWNGSSWTLVHTVGAFEEIHALAVSTGGTVVVGGQDGLPFGTAFVDVIAGASTTRFVGDPFTQVSHAFVAPDGDVFVAGTFTTLGVPSNGMVRLVGATFVAADGGFGITDTAWFPNGDLLTVGSGSGFGGTSNHHVARLAPTCAPGALATAPGCAGSGGPNVLTATSLPWIGSTFSARATGMPNGGLAVSVRGFATASIALSSLLPQGTPSCFLTARPDLLELHVPSGGVFDTSVAIPDDPVIVGLVYHEQVVAFDITSSGLQSLTATNRLSMTIGRF